eukprot:scaffold17867_cov40-Phaeocystis_antarctica.AAC.4
MPPPQPRHGARGLRSCWCRTDAEAMAWDDDEEELPEAVSLSLTDLSTFDDAVYCLLDDACAAYHEGLRTSVAAGSLSAQDREHAVPCLIDAECAGKYLPLVARMRAAPCDPKSACPGGRGCNLKTPTLSPPRCTSLVLGRLTRGLLANPRSAPLYVGEVVDGKVSGLGSMRNRDGTHFVGRLAAGLPVSGRYRFLDGSLFVGEFAAGAPNGTDGEFLAARGEGRYRGGVLSGRAHGRGTVTTKEGAELEAEFRLGRPEAGYSPGPQLSVRRGEGAAALSGGDARAVLAANRDAWHEVLERMAGRRQHRAADQLKVRAA